jgi:hypothetical protein
MHCRLIAIFALTTSFSASASITNTAITINGSGSITVGGPFTYDYSGTGTAALAALGTASFSAHGGGVYFNNVVGLTIGTFMLDFGGGNTMTGSFSLPGNILAPNLQGKVFPLTPVSFSITMGTGIYSGAVGNFTSVTGSGTATLTSMAPFTLAAEGAISLPGIPATPVPGTMPMIVIGLVTCLIYQIRKQWAGTSLLGRGYPGSQ